MVKGHCYLHKMYTGPKHLFSKYFFGKVYFGNIHRYLNGKIRAKNVPAGRSSSHLQSQYQQVAPRVQGHLWLYIAS